MPPTFQTRSYIFQERSTLFHARFLLLSDQPVLSAQFDHSDMDAETYRTMPDQSEQHAVDPLAVNSAGKSRRNTMKCLGCPNVNGMQSTRLQNSMTTTKTPHLCRTSRPTAVIRNQRLTSLRHLPLPSHRNQLLNCQIM
jgi:hypothetical protein